MHENRILKLIRCKKIIEKSLMVLGILVLLTTALSMNATASESNLTVTNLTAVPETIELGENVTITALIENTGNTTSNETIVFKIDGDEVKSVNLSIKENETDKIEFEVIGEEEGTHNVSVNSMSASFNVVAQPTPTPVASSPSPTPTLTITETPKHTSTPETGKFRLPPVVKIRPVNDIIKKDDPGLVEFYFSNPSLNDLALTADVYVSVPAGVHVSGEGFSTGGAAGTVHGQFQANPNIDKTVYMNIVCEKVGRHMVHTEVIYYPGDNKDSFQQISLTHPFECEEVTITPSPSGPSPNTPGFEFIPALAAILAIGLLVVTKRK